MKEVLIILDGLMEKSFEGMDLRSLILGNIDVNYSLDMTEFSVEGRDVDSLNCIMNMLGYSPLDEDIGDRSFYEGLNQGVSDYQYILRCNIVKVEKGILKDFTGGSLREDIGEVIRELNINNGYIHPCYQYKNLLVINSSRDDLSKVKFYPPHFHVGEDIDSMLPSSKDIREIINNSYEFFKSKEMEGCILWPWGASEALEIKSFYEKYNKTAGIVSGIDLVSGIGKALAMKSIQPIECNGDYNTNLNNKLKAAIGLIKDVDILIVHINGFDELAHRKDFKGKLEFIKKVQSEFLIPLINNLKIYNKCNITITCDHRTDSFSGSHESGKVPVLKIK